MSNKDPKENLNVIRNKTEKRLCLIKFSEKYLEFEKALTEVCKKFGYEKNVRNYRTHPKIEGILTEILFEKKYIAENLKFEKGEKKDDTRRNSEKTDS